MMIAILNNHIIIVTILRVSLYIMDLECITDIIGRWHAHLDQMQNGLNMMIQKLELWMIKKYSIIMELHQKHQ